MSIDDKLLRVSQVAELLGVSKSTVWLYARESKIPRAQKLSARVSVWKQSDILAFMNERVA